MLLLKNYTVISRRPIFEVIWGVWDTSRTDGCMTGGATNYIPYKCLSRIDLRLGRFGPVSYVKQAFHPEFNLVKYIYIHKWLFSGGVSDWCFVVQT